LQFGGHDWSVEWMVPYSVKCYNRVQEFHTEIESMPPARLRQAWKRGASWSCVLFLNLLIPVLLGLDATSTNGAAGMMAGIAVCWLVGLAVCVVAPRWEAVFFQGGLVVAASQFFPILQFAAGIFGLWAWESIAPDVRLHSDGLSGLVAGFAVTLLTAQPLLIAAWLFGGGIRMLSTSDAVDADAAADYAEQLKANTAPAQPGIAPNPEQA
jgi:hypothetical protein